jgi:predicted HTH transcriptional regulator
LASPILRETIKKLRARKAQLQKEIKGPLEELRQIEEDLQALGASSSSAGSRGTRAPRGAHQVAILRAIRNGATTPAEISDKTTIAASTVNRSLAAYVDRQKLVTRGANGLTLTKSGRDKLRALEAQ